MKNKLISIIIIILFFIIIVQGFIIYNNKNKVVYIDRSITNTWASNNIWSNDTNENIGLSEADLILLWIQSDDDIKEAIELNRTSFRWKSEEMDEMYVDYLCKNPDRIKPFYYDRYLSSDEEFKNFISSWELCINTILDWFLDKSLLNIDWPERNYLYDNCYVDREWVEELWPYFWDYFEALNIILRWYYSDNIDESRALSYLDKFSKVPREDYIYYQWLESALAKLSYDVISGKKYTDEECSELINEYN